jgi:hypothetical protein
VRKSEAMTLPGTLWHDSNLRQVWATTQGSSEKRALFKRRKLVDSVARISAPLLLYQTCHQADTYFAGAASTAGSLHAFEDLKARGSERVTFKREKTRFKDPIKLGLAWS